MDVWLLDEHVLIFGRASGRDFDALGEQLPPAMANWELAELPDELYLRRFLRLDAANAEQVRSFCADYGVVGEPDDMSDFPLGVLDDARAMFADSETGVEPRLPSVGFEDTAAPPLRQTWARIWARDRDWFDAMFSERGISPVPLVVYAAQTITQVAAYQTVFRYMLKMWLTLSEQIDVKGVADLRSSQSPVPMLDGAGVWLGQYGCDLLARFLNTALTPFHVRLDSGLPRPISELPNVYQAMCLQLANHIAENARYRPCAAEDCDNPFVRTEGYSRYGQNRLRGNKYCSQRCANRQAQRDYRRRNPRPGRESGPSVNPAKGGSR